MKLSLHLPLVAGLILSASFSLFGQNYEQSEKKPLPTAHPKVPHVGYCGQSHRHETPPPSFPQPQSKSILTNPIVRVQSIHNVIAKWDAGSVYRFDFGTAPGADDIYNGHLLWNTDKHTIGHSFAELQNYAAAQGTAFNIGDVFYLNLYTPTALDTAFQCQFVWEDLGNAGNNVTITVETNYGLNGAPPFANWQANQMMAFYNLVNPIIRDIFGPPSRNHNINIVNDAYATNTNTYFNGPNQVNTSYVTNGDGDLDQPRLMVHEIIHAYRDNVTLSSDAEWHYDPELSGFEEGMAEAAAIIVMDKFAELYPNFWNGDEFRIHWDHARGMPFGWDYDFQNHPQLTTQDFFSSDIATGSHWLRYGTGAAAIRKMYIENNDFFIDFNAAYYAAMNADHTLLPSRDLIVNIINSIQPEVERTPTLTWLDNQRIFDCSITPGQKVFMLTFTGLNWSSFQHDNRIHFMETHDNGMEWRWNSSDQAGTNEVPDGAPNADWAWTHQLNNTPGNIQYIRDWNNSTWGSKNISNDDHWLTDQTGPYWWGNIIGPHQGPNPYYVGATFTRDHEQDNCTAVPGCGKRAWAIGNQQLYATSSDAANMWPMIVSQGGQIPNDRVELNMTESGLFRYQITFNDAIQGATSETYYRLQGNTFIAPDGSEGLIGGIFSPTQNAVDGRMFIEHEDHGEEAALPLTNNAFKANRTWTSILATQPQYQGGRNDRKYSDPGKVHAIYTNPDCSEKKIDFRTIGYGDGLEGTQMLLFNRDEFEDIIFTESADLTVLVGDNFNLNVVNNFPDILDGDSRITYSWVDPAGNPISSSTDHLFNNAQLTDSGTYLMAIDFFGCPTFNLDVHVSVSTALPVEIIEFDATVTPEQEVALTWSTAAEINSDYFTIEKSQDGNNWSYVTTVNAMGNSNSLVEYRALDPTPWMGTSYYRLLLTNIDGTKEESGMDKVNISPSYQLYPVPADEEIHLDGKGIQQQQITVYNSLGQQVPVNAIGSKDHLRIPVSHLSGGVYYLEVISGIHREKMKFVIQ